MAAKTKNDFSQDPEMQAMLSVFGALQGLEADAQVRVMEYVEQRLGLSRQRKIGARSDDSAENAGEDTDTRGQDASVVSARSNDVREQLEDDGALAGISPIAKKWMQRNGLSATALSALYSLGVDEIDLVAKKVPGKSARDRLHNVLLLQGVASYLNSGAPRIENEKLREACAHYDADVGGNFATYLKDWATEVSGSRVTSDLTLTTRGLNSAKEVILQILGAGPGKEKE